MKIKINYWIPVLVWGGIIFTFSSISTSPVSTVYWKEFAIKKAAHIIEYGILSILIYRALINSDVRVTTALIVAPILSFLYGMSDEYHQSFTPGREPTVRDTLFDAFGSVIAMIFVSKILPNTTGNVREIINKFELIKP